MVRLVDSQLGEEAAVSLILASDGNCCSDIQLEASTLSPSVELLDLQGDAASQNNAGVDRRRALHMTASLLMRFYNATGPKGKLRLRDCHSYVEHS